MRALAATLALALFAMCATAQAQTADLGGAWLGTQLDERSPSGGYFRVELTQDDMGRLRGEGVIDPCPRCAGFMEYRVTWEGILKSDLLALTGTPVHAAGRRGIASFRGRAVGDGYQGVLTGVSRSQSIQMLLERAQPDE